MKWIFFLMVCMISVTGTGIRWAAAQQTEPEAASSLSVAGAVFCRGVEEREPVGNAVTFSPDTGRIYLWTEIEAARIPATVTHVWYYGQTKLLEVPLSVDYSRTRTWSYKTIVPDWVGDWHADIVDENGTVLKRVSFTIGGDQEQ